MADVPIPPELVQDPFEKNVPGIGVGRDPARTPMRWSGQNYGGFTAGRPWLPIGQNLAHCNVESEAADPDSMLSLTRRLLRLRREEPSLAVGGYQSVPCHEDCLTYVRSHDGRQLLVMLNFSADHRRLPLPPEVPKARLLLSSDASRKLQPVHETIELKGVEGVIMEAM
jgi:alpha-glucosidase